MFYRLVNETSKYKIGILKQNVFAYLNESKEKPHHRHIHDVRTVKKRSVIVLCRTFNPVKPTVTRTSKLMVIFLLNTLFEDVLFFNITINPFNNPWFTSFQISSLKSFTELPSFFRF